MSMYYSRTILYFSKRMYDIQLINNFDNKKTRKMVTFEIRINKYGWRDLNEMDIGVNEIYSDSLIIMEIR